MNHLEWLIPVSEQSTLHIWQPWAREPAFLRSHRLGGAVCSLPASRWCCCLLADPLVCPRSGRVCEGNGVKSQEPTMEKSHKYGIHVFFNFIVGSVFSQLLKSQSKRACVWENWQLFGTTCPPWFVDLIFLPNFNKNVSLLPLSFTKISTGVWLQIKKKSSGQFLTTVLKFKLPNDS